MSVSPLSRGPRTITEGDVLAVAAALAPTIAAELTATRADLEGLVASTVRPERRALTVGGSIRIPADATPPVD